MIDTIPSTDCFVDRGHCQYVAYEQFGASYKFDSISGQYTNELFFIYDNTFAFAGGGWDANASESFFPTGSATQWKFDMLKVGDVMKGGYADYRQAPYEYCDRYGCFLYQDANYIQTTLTVSSINITNASQGDSTDVPEPSTLGLCSLFNLTLLASRRLKRR